MIDRCFNPYCNRQLHYLRDGRVIRLIRHERGHPIIEHYWLCGACYNTYDFHFSNNDTIGLGPRFKEYIHLEPSLIRGLPGNFEYTGSKINSFAQRSLALKGNHREAKMPAGK